MATGTWIYEKGGLSGGGGTGGGTPAPKVTIDSADLIFRSDHRVEVDVEWTPDATATAQNFSGVNVYLEDPDISTGANHPLDGGSMPLDGSAQVSGEWAPVLVNDSTKSPAVVFLDTTMGSTFGQTYKAPRDVRIYLAAYGPSSHSHLVRATESNPTPNIMVNIPQARGSGESGQEWAFLVTNVSVAVTTDYNRQVPQYFLVLRYTPPSPAIPVPPGLNHFGGCRIKFVYEDDAGNPIFPAIDTRINVPVVQADSGYKSDGLEPKPGGSKYRVYFCSEDDSQPLGHHVNTLIEGTTPFAYAIVPPVPATPDVTNFSISGQKTVWYQDGSMVAHADFSWHLPDAENNIRYAGVYLYLVKVTGGGSKPTVFPKDLTGPQANVAVSYPLEIPDVPKVAETWTIAAISYDTHGVLADDPKTFGTPAFHSPFVTWVVGPPTPGSAGSGEEYAPKVTINAGAAVTATQTMSADGVGMVSFNVGAWTNPTDNQFGSAQVAMVINNDPTKPTFWSVPVNATSFQTPAIPSFGNIGSPVTVDFYVVSDDPQGHKNSLQATVTPKIRYTYTPTAGAIIPARSGWFDDTQFSWITDPQGSGKQVMHADNITADNIYISKVLVVGGDPNPTFKGMSNGQIAVKNSSGTLRAWMGEQQPGQGTGPGLWGGWFGQLWVGGTNPLDAPLWVDNQGIIQVGGIAARQGAVYPYLSIRDQTGLEMGRIGASINKQTGLSGDNAGTNPPAALTAGAWFSQLAIGGNNLTNWNVLITPDTSKPLGSLFQMRNIFMFSIDYASQQLTQPYNAAYRLEMGSSAWVTPGGSSWQFPGIRIYEVEGFPGNQFGAYYISRGVVLRGTGAQNYQVLASLVTFNGQSSGSNSPPQFWAELAMYSPLSAARTVYLTSGGLNQGSPSFILLDVSGNLLFQVDTAGSVYLKGALQGAPVGGNAQPVNAIAYNVNGYGPVIDSQGNWKGKAIASGAAQSPWTGPINGQGFTLSNTGTISAAQYGMNNGTIAINTNGTFVGPGIQVQGYGIGCSSLQLYGGPIDGVGTVTCNSVNSGSGYVGGSFRGAGVACQGYGIGCSSLQLYGGPIDGVGTINCNSVNTNAVNSSGGYTGGSFRGSGVNVGSYGIGGGSLTIQGPASINGAMNCTSLQIGGTQRIDSAGIYRGSVQWPDNIYGNSFGIYSLYVGVANGGFYDRDGNYHQIHGGLITT